MTEYRDDEVKNILEQMRNEYWQGLEEEPETGEVATREFLFFELGGERFGVAGESVREVLKVPRLIRVPRVPDHIPGVFNLRGEVCAVTDLRSLLGLAGRELPAHGRLLVVEAAGVVTALYTDRVEGLVSIEAEAIEPFTEGLAGFPREVAEGQLHQPQGLVVLLKLGAILARPEFVIDEQGT